MQTECRNRTIASLSAVLLISGFFLWVCVKNEVNDGQIWALVLTIVLLFLFFGALYVSGYKENREKRSLFHGRGDPNNSNNPRLRPLTRSDPGHPSAQDRNVSNEDGYRVIPLTNQRPVSSGTNRQASVPVPVPVLHFEENFSESQREMGQRSRSPSGSSSRGSRSPISHHMESIMFPLKNSTSRTQIHYSRLDHFVEKLNPKRIDVLLNADDVFNGKKDQENEYSELVPPNYRRLRSCSENDVTNSKCPLRTP